MKGEADPPIRPDSEYPDWLFKLLDPQPTVSELQRQYEGPGLTLAQASNLLLPACQQRAAAPSARQGCRAVQHSYPTASCCAPVPCEGAGG